MKVQLLTSINTKLLFSEKDPASNFFKKALWLSYCLFMINIVYLTFKTSTMLRHFRTELADPGEVKMTLITNCFKT